MALATLLLERPQTRLLLIGGEADESSFEALQRNLPNDRIELARNLPLADLARRLRDCAWFLGHDSGISHLAAAVGTPSVLLFGPTDPAIWAPQNPQVRIVRAPCLTMLGIEQSAVMAAARELSAMY
jgi:heptosyltransferase-2